MREPKTWYDQDLLEDEPFLSAFKAPQIADPPACQCTEKVDDGDRNDIIVREIEKDRKLVSFPFHTHITSNFTDHSLRWCIPGLFLLSTWIV